MRRSSIRIRRHPVSGIAPLRRRLG